LLFLSTEYWYAYSGQLQIAWGDQGKRAANSAGRKKTPKWETGLHKCVFYGGQIKVEKKKHGRLT